MNERIRCWTGLAAAALILGAPAIAPAAEDFPTKTIRIVAPNPAGGTGDLVARLIGKHLGEVLETPVVIDNRPGGQGVIGVNAVTRAEPDGYTLLSAPIGGLSAALIKDPPFDILKDLEPVSSMCRGGYMLFVNDAFPANNLSEFIAYAKANPAKVNVGTSSPLSSLGFEVFKKMAGTDITTVPYKGSTPAMTAVVGGQIHGVFDGPGTYSGFVQSGQVRGLLFSSNPRLDTFPQVPSASESGLKDFRVGYTTALWAPAGTPRDVLDKLSRAVATVVKLPEVQKILRENSLEPISMTPDELRKVGKEEVEFFMQAARAADLQPQ